MRVIRMLPNAIRQHVLVFHSPSMRRTALLDLLRQAGHHVSFCDSSDRMLELLDGTADAPSPDLIVLRAEGPARDGLRLLQRIRATSAVLVVLIGHPADGYSDRVAALELGADDYLAWGMPLAEMLARIRAVLRRSASARIATLARPLPATEPSLRPIQGGWQLAPHRRALVSKTDGQSLPLTGAEFDLLRLLETAGGGAVDRDTISRTVFRRPWRVEDRAVDGLIKRLRRKLQADAIASVRGVGYALRFEDADQPGRASVEICVPHSASPAPELQSPVVE
jgi:DNA-binding response OmpR family regulator